VNKTIVLIDKTEGNSFARGEMDALARQLQARIKENPIILIWPNLRIAQIMDLPIEDEGVHSPLFHDLNSDEKAAVE
jgi:hypothetical protein